MQQEELTTLIENTAVLMEEFKRICGTLAQRQQTLTQQLQLAAQQAPGVLQQSAEAALSAIPHAVIERIGEGLDKPVAAYEKRLQEAAEALQASVQTVRGDVRAMQRLLKALVWKTFGAIGMSLVLSIVAGSLLCAYYYRTIRDQQLKLELLDAANAADITLCDGRLCANVDSKGKRYGSSGQYLPTRPR